MYAKIELTRRVFKFWKFDFSVSDEVFVGPFSTGLHRNLVMRLVTSLTVNLLRDKSHVLVRWTELEQLPVGGTAIAAGDAMDAVLVFIMDL